ncbi:MAG: class I SAM-dependent methyltransferase [Actinomycetota bacterium]|nr:class I SAM-dependent methyltransferase [Actinomycetota bacterium]
MSASGTSDSSTWDKRYASSELVWSEGPNQLVSELVSPLEPGRAIDLGTGEGRNAIWLATKGWEVTGVDFSRAGLEKARQLASKRGVDVTWVVADLTGDFMPEEGAFDLALIAYLHLPADQLQRVLTRAARSIAPGGTLLVVGHDLSNIDRGTGGPQDPAILYTTDTLSRILDEAGIDLVLERSEVVKRVVTPAASTADVGAEQPAKRSEGIAFDTLVLGRRQ